MIILSGMLYLVAYKLEKKNNLGRNLPNKKQKFYLIYIFLNK